VTIHTKTCKHIDSIDPERLVDVEWDEEGSSLHQVRIKIISSGQAGTLADVAAVLKKREVNILEADIRTGEDHRGMSNFLIQVHDTHQLHRVLKELKRIKNVYEVSRDTHN
jgi:guanosine-3',5'-bis(diphosphate) 3'-pyrophosphohydrolase